jgi:hypothetical protein
MTDTNTTEKLDTDHEVKPDGVGVCSTPEDPERKPTSEHNDGK